MWMGRANVKEINSRGTTREEKECALEGADRSINHRVSTTTGHLSSCLKKEVGNEAGSTLLGGS